MKFFNWALFAGAAGLITIALAACSGTTEAETTGSTAGTETHSDTPAGVSGTLNIDGSGTVYPISAGLVEVFNSKNPDAKITVGKAGTGSGMKTFAKGEIEIADASRPIKAEEIKALDDAKIEFIELPIAYDGICIIVNKANDFVKDLTIEQLNRLWDPSRANEKTKWSDLNPAWPAREIKLYGPTDAHGTYEYFNEVVNGDGKKVRQDYSQQAEYDPLITGVAGDPDALGYIGFAYFEQNQDKLTAVPIKTNEGTVAASFESIADGTYKPFGRPLMMYVNKSKLESNPVVKSFLELVLSTEAHDVIKQVGYVPLPDATSELVKKRFADMKTGSVLSSAAAGSSLDQLLSK